MADQFITAFAGTIVRLNMDDAVALTDLGLIETFSDQIDIGGGSYIDIAGLDPISGFGQLGFAGATLCASPTDAVSPPSGGTGVVRYVY